jgi:two-component system, cell cycle sensor histidine kinase and response regulator CckA
VTPDAWGPDPARLLAELRLHQAELEAQNEELRLARDAAQQALVDYTDLYEFAPVGYATMRDDGTILEANLQLASLLGVDRVALRGRSIMDWILVDDRPRLLPILARANGGGPTSAADFTLVLAEGRTRSVAVTATHMAAAPSIRVAFTDQTDLRLAERAAQQVARMESIARLAGGIAHDLNNVLTVVRVHDDYLLQTTPPEDDRHDGLVAIHDALGQAAGLTSRLMAFARPQVFQRQRVAVNALIGGIASSLQRMLPSTVTVRTALAPEVGDVLADPAQLEQVLTQLALNAAEAMPEGGTLSVETLLLPLDAEALRTQPGIVPGPFVRISAVDTGRGMGADTVAHLFEPYFTTKARGSGLGLAMVYAVVRQAGGFVRAESTPGIGTCIHLCVPAAAPVEAGAAVPAATAVAAGGHETVLVVDDEPAIRHIVARMLARRGYTVHEAEDGAHALEVLESLAFSVDLIVSDVVMPRVSGPELVSKVRERQPGMRVVFMTGYASSEELAEGRVPPNLGILHKPFSLADLEQLVRRALDVG